MSVFVSTKTAAAASPNFSGDFETDMIVASKSCSGDREKGSPSSGVDANAKDDPALTTIAIVAAHKTARGRRSFANRSFPPPFPHRCIVPLQPEAFVQPAVYIGQQG